MPAITSVDCNSVFQDWLFCSDHALPDTQLVELIINALLTDRRVSDDEPAHLGKRGGWWADPTFGSRLWTLKGRQLSANELIRTIVEYIQEALQFLVDDGIASDIETTVKLESSTTVLVNVTILSPDETERVFALSGQRNNQYQWLWSPYDSVRR